MTTLLLLFMLFSMLSSYFSAKGDAQRDNGKMNHYTEAFADFFLLLSAFCPVIVTYESDSLSAGVLTLSAYLLFRFGAFNIFYNSSRYPKKPIHYVGSSDNASVFDKVLIRVPERFRLALYAISIFIAFTLVAIVEEVF